MWLTCVYSWQQLLPRCWSWGWSAPLSSGSWCHHCLLRRKACRRARPPRRCCVDSTCWRWRSTCCSVQPIKRRSTCYIFTQQIHLYRFTPSTASSLGKPGNRRVFLMINLTAVYLGVIFLHCCEMWGAVITSHRIQAAIWRGKGSKYWECKY